ncbi:MAG: D-alanine--D-alanine ligase [Bacteroidales bacterium]|nr:D-alanine--D-alanine ligase [Bacteroidales bacterium]
MKKKIAIVTGGDSGEMHISLKSAKIIESNIDRKKFDTYVISITNEGWIYHTGVIKQTVDKNDFSIIADGRKVKFDAVFIAIHGTPGENGKLQGYFDLLNIPYTSCDLITSALTFNKFFCSQLLSGLKICHVADAVLLRKGANYSDAEIINKVGLPCFVKPNEAGSSLGISKVKEKNELRKAIDLAFSVDQAVVIEKFVKGREITCGVLNFDNEIMALPITEIISKNEYFDFDAKYDKNKADEITPAVLPQHITEYCQHVSKELYVFFNCKGVVRFDYILTDDEKMFFLEVNSIPGMTDESIVPKQAEAAGISIGKLFTTLIENALKHI